MTIRHPFQLLAGKDLAVPALHPLGQPDSLAEWRTVDAGITSALAEVECLRTRGRLRVVGRLPDKELATRREAVYGVLATLTVVGVSRSVLDLAAQPLPTAPGPLEAWVGDGSQSRVTL